MLLGPRSPFGALAPTPNAERLRALKLCVLPELTQLRNSTLVDSPAAGFFGGGWPFGGLQIEAVATFESPGAAEFGMCLTVPASNQSACPLRVGLIMLPGGTAVEVTVTGADGGSGVVAMPVSANEPIAVRAYVDQQFAEVDINQGRAVFSGMGTNGINNPNLGTDVGITVFTGEGTTTKLTKECRCIQSGRYGKTETGFVHKASRGIQSSNQFSPLATQHAAQ